MIKKPSFRLLQRFKQSFSSGKPLSQIYEEASEKNAIKKDVRQINTIALLDTLRKQILDTHETWKNHNVSYTYHTGYESEYDDGEGHPNTTGGLFSSFFSKAKKKQTNSTAAAEKDLKKILRKDKLKGIYLYGTPGSGKTFLMDLFFENVPILEKKRVHFNEFMLSIHDQMHRIKSKSIKDPLSHIAMANAHSYRLLCLDEFQVTDIADALIIKRLFENLFEHNLVLLATSNREPDALYKDGLQRHLFLPFIPYLKTQCDIVNIDSNVDYRYSESSEKERMYTFLSPVDSVSDAILQKTFNKLSESNSGTPMMLKATEGREIPVRKAYNNVAFFEFDDLCDKPMGSSDFIAIARRFHSILIRDIPILTFENRNLVKRFIFSRRDLKNLSPKKGAVNHDEEFALDRCISRIVEMQSKKYLDEESYWESHQKGKNNRKADTAPNFE